jgi:hypothetical protein
MAADEPAFEREGATSSFGASLSVGDCSSRIKVLVACDKSHHIVEADSDDVDDSDVGQGAGGGPRVDRGGADAEHRGDLANRQELLDWR